MRAAGHDQKFVHVGRAGDDRLGSGDDDPVLASFLHMDIGVAFPAGPAARAVALGIRHRDAERQVAVLHIVHVARKRW